MDKAEEDMLMPDRLNVDLLTPDAVTAKAEEIGVKKAKNTNQLYF